MLRVRASLLVLSMLAAATMGCGSNSSSGSGSGGTGGAAGANGGGGGGASGAAGTSGNGGNGGMGTAGAGGTNAGGAGGASGAAGAAGATSCAGNECVAFPKSWVRGCTNDQSCVSELHQLDCCGAMRALGVNHSEANKFCAAEYGNSTNSGCRASYPSPAPCVSNVITVDTGDTTTDPNRVGVRCDSIDPKSGIGTCTTFVCPGNKCPVDNGTCGP